MKPLVLTYQDNYIKNEMRKKKCRYEKKIHKKNKSFVLF